MSNLTAWLTIVPFINKNYSLLDRSSRMTIVHHIFTYRNRLSCLFDHSSDRVCPDSVGLDDMISLYYPKLRLDNDPSPEDVMTFRHHTHTLLLSLFPARLPSCVIEHDVFRHNDREVNLYFIRNNRLSHWKNSDRPLIVYLHGGGFVSGGNDTYFGLECQMSEDLNMLVLHVDYGLLPEQPLARTMEDILAVYQMLLRSDIKISQRIIGMADSSGGMLWIYLLQWLVSNGKSRPRAVILHSPWPSLDFIDIDPFVNTNPYMSVDLALTYRRLAIGSNVSWSTVSPEEKAKISPKPNSYAGFPPMYITVGTNDVFLSEVLTMVENIREAGSQVIVDVSRGSMHSFPLFHRWSSAARCAQMKIHQWIDEQFYFPKTLPWDPTLTPKVRCKS